MEVNIYGVSLARLEHVVVYMDACRKLCPPPCPEFCPSHLSLCMLLGHASPEI